MESDPVRREMTRLDFEAKLQIDRHRLDDALIEQGQLFYQVSHAFALAVSNRDATKDRLRRVEAELWIATREDLERESDRVTEATVAKSVELQPAYRKLRKRLLVATQEADLWQAMKEAYTQRGYILKDLCGLFVANYYADNAVHGASVQKVEELHTAKQRAAIAARRKKLVRR